MQYNVRSNVSVAAVQKISRLRAEQLRDFAEVHERKVSLCPRQVETLRFPWSYLLWALCRSAAVPAVLGAM